MDMNDSYYEPLKNMVELLQSIDDRLENIENQLSEEAPPVISGGIRMDQKEEKILAKVYNQNKKVYLNTYGEWRESVITSFVKPKDPEFDNVEVTFELLDVATVKGFGPPEVTWTNPYIWKSRGKVKAIRDTLEI